MIATIILVILIISNLFSGACFVDIEIMNRYYVAYHSASWTGYMPKEPVLCEWFYKNVVNGVMHEAFGLILLNFVTMCVGIGLITYFIVKKSRIKAVISAFSLAASLFMMIKSGGLIIGYLMSV